MQSAVTNFIIEFQNAQLKVEEFWHPSIEVEKMVKLPVKSDPRSV